MFFLVYLLIMFIVWCLALLYVVREDAQHERRDRDNGDFFMMGMVCAGLGLIWPLSMFGLIAIPIGSHYKRKGDREREITRELSRG